MSSKGIDQDLRNKITKHVETSRSQTSIAPPFTPPSRPFVPPALFTPKSFKPPISAASSVKEPTPLFKLPVSSVKESAPLFKPPVSSVKEPESISRETKQPQAKSFQPLVKSTQETLSVDNDTKLLFATVSERLDTIVRSINELHQWNLKIEKNIIDRINALESAISNQSIANVQVIEETTRERQQSRDMKSSIVFEPTADTHLRSSPKGLISKEQSKGVVSQEHEASTAHDAPMPTNIIPTPSRPKNKKKKK